LEFILGYLFAPLMWLIGVATEDITLVGQAGWREGHRQ
jgi:CNT family concentrative nucleoside transporter